MGAEALQTSEAIGLRGLAEQVLAGRDEIGGVGHDLAAGPVEMQITLTKSAITPA